MSHWKQRVTFGRWRTERDIAEDVPLAYFADDERLLFAYMDNEHLGAIVLIFEKGRERTLYSSFSLLALPIAPEDRWRPMKMTWDNLARQDWLKLIKPYGARKKLLSLIAEHGGVQGATFDVACHSLFPEHAITRASA